MFRNRGNLPHIEFNQGRDNNDNGPEGFHVPYFTNYWNGYYYVVHYDAKLVVTQAITIIFQFTKGDIFGEVLYPTNTNNELFVEAKGNCEILSFIYDNIMKECIQCTEQEQLIQ